MYIFEDDFYDELMELDERRVNERLGVVKLVRDVDKENIKRKREERREKIRQRKQRRERQRILGED